MMTPPIKTQPKKLSIAEKIVLGWFGGILILGIGNKIFRMFVPEPFIPQTCEEARSSLQQAKADEAKEWKRLEDGRSPSMGAANIAIQDAKAVVSSAESGVASACRK